MNNKVPIYGDRSRQSITADLKALREWVRQRQTNAPSGSGQLRLVEDAGRMSFVLAMQDGASASSGDMPIARFQLSDGSWHLFWADRNGKWNLYDDRDYLTLAIPMVLVDQDADGVFWR